MTKRIAPIWKELGEDKDARRELALRDEEKRPDFCSLTGSVI